jgi:hypothetical protein
VVDDELDALREETVGSESPASSTAEVAIGDASARAHSSVSRNDRDVPP